VIGNNNVMLPFLQMLPPGHDDLPDGTPPDDGPSPIGGDAMKKPSCPAVHKKGQRVSDEKIQASGHKRQKDRSAPKAHRIEEALPESECAFFVGVHEKHFSGDKGGNLLFSQRLS
jgi:hypothetical protein